MDAGGLSPGEDALDFTNGEVEGFGDVADGDAA